MVCYKAAEAAARFGGRAASQMICCQAVCKLDAVLNRGYYGFVKSIISKRITHLEGACNFTGNEGHPIRTAFFV